MGATQVAEGPLIKHVPGGFAEWRAKESGLPPARLHSSEGEWWGKLVGPTDATTPDPILGWGGDVDDSGVGDSGDSGGYIGSDFRDEEKQGLDPAAFDETLRNKLNEEQDQPNYNWYDWDVDQRWKPDNISVDWDVNYNPMPEGFGWGVPTGSPLPYQRGGSGVAEGPSGRGAVVPGGQGDRLTTRGSAGLQKPLVDFKPSPTEYAEGYDPNNRFVEKPGVVNEAIEDLKDVATDGLKLGEKWIDAIAGKTAADFKPRNPKESVLFNKFKKGYEIFVAAIKEGGGVFGGTLYETGGGRTTMPNTKTGEVPQAHFANIYKTLRKVFAGEKDPIVMQEYGDLHWPTIIATIGLANTYGPIVWAIPGLRTMADTIGASMNGMLMDKPNLEGNPIQDTMHRLFWVAGQAGEKAYEISIGKLIEKLRGTPKSDKTRGTISEELSDLINIKDAYKGHKTQRIKIKLDPEFESAGSKHLQPDHDPLDLQTTDPKSGAGRQKGQENLDPEFYSDGEFVPPPPVDQTTSPGIIQGSQPTEETRADDWFRNRAAQKDRGLPSPQERFDQTTPQVNPQTIVDTKTITIRPDQGLSPAGYATEPLPASQHEVWGGDYPKPIEEITVRKTPVETFGGESPTQKAPTGISIEDWIEKHGDAGHVTPPKGEPIVGEVKESVYDEIEAQAPPELDPPELPKYKIQFGDGSVHEVDWETFLEKTTPDENGVSDAIPYITPETLEELEDLGIKPADDPIDPYAQIMGDPVFIKVAIDQFGRELDHTEAGFDKSQIAGFEYRDKQFPARGKDDAAAGSEEATHAGEIGDLESWFESEKFNENQQDTGQTGQTDFRSDYQKQMGLTAGNQWVNESDSSTWPAIAATQSQQWNERTQQFDLSYNRNLPQSNIPGHPQYYENNPEHVMNATPDVNVEWTSAEDKGDNEEIFNWADQAGLNPTIYQPKYDNDYQFIGNEMFMLEAESYPKGDGWGYRYRYNSAETGERGEWREWIPGP